MTSEIIMPAHHDDYVVIKPQQAFQEQQAFAREDQEPAHFASRLQ